MSKLCHRQRNISLKYRCQRTRVTVNWSALHVPVEASRLWCFLHVCRAWSLVVTDDFRRWRAQRIERAWD